MCIARRLGYVWAAPATLVGWLVTLLLGSRVERLGWHKDVYVSRFTTRAPRCMLMRYFSHPFVLGNVAIVSVRKRDRKHETMMIDHATAHARQWMLFGVLFPVVMFAMFCLLRMLRDVDNRFDNPLEIDARRSAGQTVDIPSLKNSMLRLLRSHDRR